MKTSAPAASAASQNGRTKSSPRYRPPARAGLRLSTHGVVLENGQVRLSGTGREVLEHPEIGALYLGGAVSATPAANGTAPGAAR